LSKRIIFCADGTWDSQKNDSNVFKLFQAIAKEPGQTAFYDDGVGVDGTGIEKFLGGAFGEGLFDKIRDGYRAIASVYEPGDEIYIFGFSRGAYTARSLAGMISACGLPTKTCDKPMVDKVFDAYRDKEHRADILGSLSDNVLCKAPIKMVGVWDTVGSLGIPAVFGGVDPIRFGFLDTNLHPNIQNAYQALAIDEHRREFPPTLWTLPATPVPGQTVEQVWFPGAHSDVGGGYPDDQCGLSNITLAWMMDKAEKLGLDFDPATAAKYHALVTTADAAAKAALDTVHHSWSLWWGLPRWREVPPQAEISNSAVLRAAADQSWRPKSLDFSQGALPGGYQVADVIATAASPTPAVQPAQQQAKVLVAAASPGAKPA
jgi:uncharacterized protein (DUF2235 family)